MFHLLSQTVCRSYFQLKQNGVSVYAGHLKGDVFYKAGLPGDGGAFLIGNEGNGLTDEITALADQDKDSDEKERNPLNAAVSATILMYETMRARELM